MEDSQDEIFWGPICEREREVVKCSLLRDISECSSRIPKCKSTNEDCPSVISHSVGPEVSEEHDCASISSVKSNTYLENNCIDMRSSIHSDKISVNDDSSRELGSANSVLKSSSEQSLQEGITSENNLEVLESEVIDINRLNSSCEEERVESKLPSCNISNGSLVDREGDPVNRNTDFLSGSYTQHDFSVSSSCIQRNETSNENRSSESFVSQSLGSEISAGSNSVAVSLLKPDTFSNEGKKSVDSTLISCGGTFLVSNDCLSESVCSTFKSPNSANVELPFDGIISYKNTLEQSRRTPSNFKGNRGDSLSSSKSDSKEVFDMSLCGMKLAALTNGEAIDAATDSVLLERSSVDCSSESDCLNDTLEEVESIMKRALEFMHHGENSKENLGENKSSELQDHESKNLFGSNFEGVPLGMKPGPSHNSTSPVVRRSPKVNVGMNASPRKVAEKNASVKSKRIPQRDDIKNFKLPLKKQNFLSIASPVAQYIKYRPPPLLQNVKVKDNLQRDMPLPTLSVIPDENIRHLTPARNKKYLPEVKYNTAPVVNMNCQRFIEKNTLSKASSITPKLFKHTGRVLMAHSPSRAMSNVVCNEVSVVYEKDVSATNNLKQ